MNKPNVGGRASDRPMKSGGGMREAGPGQSGFRWIPAFPKMVEGYFLANQDVWYTYGELWDPAAPDGFKSRPVANDFQPQGNARVTERSLAPFVLTGVVEGAQTTPINNGQGEVVVIKIPKKLFTEIQTRTEMLPGQPLAGTIVRLSKSGQAKDTTYQAFWMAGNPDIAAVPTRMDGLPLEQETGSKGSDRVADWIGEQLMADFYNLDPGNPANLAGYAQNQSTKQAQPQQGVPSGMPAQQPAYSSPPVITPPIIPGFAPPTAEQLAALPLKELRDKAIENGVVPATIAKAEFTAAKDQIIAALAQALLQKAA